MRDEGRFGSCVICISGLLAYPEPYFMHVSVHVGIIGIRLNNNPIQNGTLAVFGNKAYVGLHQLSY